MFSVTSLEQHNDTLINKIQSAKLHTSYNMVESIGHSQPLSFTPYLTGRKVNKKLHTSPSVAVVLGFYNGNKFLSSQIRSILNQSHKNIKIFISDDCSKEELNLNSCDLLQEELANIYIKRTPSNVGLARNFLNSLSEVKGQFDYYAFSDQDDIWHSNKIARAIKVLSQYSTSQPSLYCARTLAVDESGEVELGVSPYFKKLPSFANALVQTIGGGNTMVFNRLARDLIINSSQYINVFFHDWWCYQIISGADGFVYYDPEPCLRYRQHTRNIMGSNNSLMAKIIRLKKLLKGNFRSWNNANINALAKNKNLLSPRNRNQLDDFYNARKSALFKRMFLAWRAGIYRQTLLGNIGLFLGLLTNKV